MRIRNKTEVLLAFSRLGEKIEMTSVWSTVMSVNTVRILSGRMLGILGLDSDSPNVALFFRSQINTLNQEMGHVQKAPSSTSK